MKLWTRRKMRRLPRRSPWQALLERLEERSLLTAPTIAPIADATPALHDTGVVRTVTVSDTDDIPAGTDPVTLTARLADGGLLPDWLVFSSTSGSGVGTFTANGPGSGVIGSIDVKVTATDTNNETDTDTFTISAFDASLTLTSANVNHTVGVHTPFELDVSGTFTDSTPDPITLSATQADGTALPAWLTFTPATGLFTGTPLDADIGAIDVKVTGTTPDLAAAIDIFSIVVPLNHTPQFTKGDDQPHLESGNPQGVVDLPWGTEIYEGPPEEYEQTLTFLVTTDNDALFSVLPTITIDESQPYPLTGALSYTLAAGASGTANVTVKLKDNGGGVDTSDSQMFVITVATSTSALVTLDNPIANQLVGVHTSFTLVADGTFTGAAHDLTATLSNGSTLPAWLTFTPGAAGSGTGTFSGIPDDPDISSIDVTLTATDAVGATVTNTFNITVPLNHTPQFTKGPNQNVNEDAGAVSVPNWATSILKGPAEEAGQVLDFIVTTNNDALFNVLPTIATDGTLTFTTASNTSGVATVTVSLHDNGGSANGGDDTSDTQTFTITVLATNDAPTFTKGPDQTVLKNSGLQTVSGWATNIDPGTNEGGQVVTFLVTTDNDSLFSVGGLPAIATDGTLTYTPALNAIGMANVTVRATDDGGITTSAAQSFKITVTDANDAPTFTLNPDPDIANPKVLLTAGPQSIPGWATVSPGPADEVGQTLNFIVTTDNPGLFRVLPAVSPTGTLTFTPLAGFGGTATITVKLHDNGGTANGGSDTSAEQTITITTYLADVTYTAIGSKKLKAVVVNGLLNVQTGGITNSRYLPAYIETLTLNGGSSDDLVNLSGLNPALYPNLRSIVINGGKGKDAITFNSLSTDAFDNFETLIINGGDGNDLINLTDLPTSLLPAITTLSLNGGAGNDTIFGSDLDDTITGGAGNDSLNGLDGTDRLVESANASFKLTDTKLTGVGTDKLASFEEAALTGGAGANKLDASLFTGHVTLSGGAGNDTLLGGSGDDALLGGDGKDSLLSGAGADTLIGGLGNDTLKGGDDNDTLIGGGGVDSLNGEAGTDTGLGGQGAVGPDRFGTGAADIGDVRTSLETIDEIFATLFAFE